MTEETEETAEVKEEVTEAAEPKAETTETPAPVKKTPQELNQERQGKSKTEKKKINAYTKQECFDEMKRLERSGHQQSQYYIDVKKKFEVV